MRKQTASKIWGVFLIVIGLSVAGHVFGWWTLRLFQGWWTFFIIVPCIISMVQDGVKTANAVGLGIGVVLLLSERTLISWAILARLFVPVALVAAGIMLLLKGSTSDNIKTKDNKSTVVENESRPSAQPETPAPEDADHTEELTPDENTAQAEEDASETNVRNTEETLDKNTAQAEGIDDPTS